MTASNPTQDKSQVDKQLDEILDDFAEEAASPAEDFEYDPARTLENYQQARKEAKAQLHQLFIDLLDSLEAEIKALKPETFYIVNTGVSIPVLPTAQVHSIIQRKKKELQ